MSRPCTLCSHPDRELIDTAILRGESYRDIARRFATSKDAVCRHREHIPAALIESQKAREILTADRIIDELRGLQDRAKALLTKAEEGGDLRAATGAIRETRGVIELLARLTGELREGPVVGVIVNAPEWVTVRTAILAALTPYPEAKAAVIEALSNHQSGDPVTRSIIDVTPPAYDSVKPRLLSDRMKSESRSEGDNHDCAE